ncbi:hypothetical protein VTK73DRAFT_2555 [Phialemonium thermophilum]|uniref:Uncharacterized protein n=1 Tax=Phialemonium thermophilum TaxID=223376 RepID=A0ABR3X4E3_9PEZI
MAPDGFPESVDLTANVTQTLDRARLTFTDHLVSVVERCSVSGHTKRRASSSTRPGIECNFALSRASI